MVRKTPKELRAEEERMLKEINDDATSKKDAKQGSNNNGLFSAMEDAKQRKEASYDEIKKYFEENAYGKQGTFYLNDQLMMLLRQKVFFDQTSIASLIRKLLIENYFTEEELKKVYNSENQ
ncbi:hypothetical protein [Lactiplantibacillus plantarum]|uniref:hypothetical protein n=1 Tax=Lactiplantibacillus plantarum TaxID=1590 RepID=UPI0007B54422|nr:hypothetical protein [Lactiplantibacillus plantarum]KZU18129.1 hypothetical protein Nizo2484_2343 [Lactiplantibacillus plantarum]KZU18602.1 hypothetical protein Nizo2457_1317 [Lactiplantibacillus plantarum]